MTSLKENFLFGFNQFEFIQVKEVCDQPCILQLILNRPEVKNAFNPKMISELKLFFNTISDHEFVHSVILTGAGSAFCAGADLNWMKSMVDFSFDENLEDSKNLWDMFEAMSFCPVPILGWAHGAVYGGALGLLACCDEVVVHENTQFCFSEVRLGLSPAIISAFILRKCVDSFVRPYMLNAKVFNANEAINMGLAHSIDSHFSIEAGVLKYKTLGPQAIRSTKILLNNLERVKNQQHWQEFKKLTTHLISERRMSDEGQLRLKSFLKK